AAAAPPVAWLLISVQPLTVRDEPRKFASAPPSASPPLVHALPVPPTAWFPEKVLSVTVAAAPWEFSSAPPAPRPGYAPPVLPSPPMARLLQNVQPLTVRFTGPLPRKLLSTAPPIPTPTKTSPLPPALPLP